MKLPKPNDVTLLIIDTIIISSTDVYKCVLNDISGLFQILVVFASATQNEMTFQHVK
jgi:hypothetical protein